MSTTESAYSFIEASSEQSSSSSPYPNPAQKYVVIGGGPVGALAAIYAAERGHQVEVYEFRNDLRDPSTVPLNFTKSINLSLSERGIHAMKWSGRPDLLDKVMKHTIPMRGRMIHGRAKSGILTEEAQDYDIHGRTNYACDRGDLNACLLDALEAMPNVKLFFNHKLVGADFKAKKAWLEVKTPISQKEIEITFDLCIGADGAFSATRYHMAKYCRQDYKQEYIDTLWCEFHIDPATVNFPSEAGFNSKVEASDFKSKFKISPNHLHIWPGKDHMFIAIPSLDGSFTCTLFMPAAQFASLEATSANLEPFFNQYFPGVTELIHPAALRMSFDENPHLPLISITCKPYHFSDSCVVVGDAAHAMVPFYGQGMNAGLESVRVLFDFLDKKVDRAEALSEYSKLRAPDASAINKLALDNYIEMRADVTSRLYKYRKSLEEWLSVNFPSLGWHTKYSMVSFGNERYSEVVRKTDRQGQIIRWCVYGALATPFVGALFWAGWRWRSFAGVTRKAAKGQAWFAWAHGWWL